MCFEQIILPVVSGNGLERGWSGCRDTDWKTVVIFYARDGDLGQSSGAGDRGGKLGEISRRENSRGLGKDGMWLGGGWKGAVKLNTRFLAHGTGQIGGPIH